MAKGVNGIGFTRIAGLSTVHLLSVILQGTPITLLTVSLSHLLCGSRLLISRALHTPAAAPKKHSALLFRIPSQIPKLYLVFILFTGLLRFALPTPSHHTGQTPVTVSCHAVSQMVFSRLDLSDTWTGCNLQVPPTTAGLASRP